MNVPRKVGSVINAAAKFTACNRNAICGFDRGPYVSAR